MLLGGPRLRVHGRREAFLDLANSFQGGVATTADGKGLFPEDHPQYIGEGTAAVCVLMCTIVLLAGVVQLCTACTF